MSKSKILDTKAGPEMVYVGEPCNLGRWGFVQSGKLLGQLTPRERRGLDSRFITVDEHQARITKAIPEEAKTVGELHKEWEAEPQPDPSPQDKRQRIKHAKG